MKLRNLENLVPQVKCSQNCHVTDCAIQKVKYSVILPIRYEALRDGARECATPELLRGNTSCDDY